MQKNINLLIEEITSQIQTVDDDWDAVDRYEKLLAILYASYEKAKLDFKKHKAEYKYLKAMKKKDINNNIEEYLCVLDAIINTSLMESKENLRKSKVLRKDISKALTVFRILFKHYKKA